MLSERKNSITQIRNDNTHDLNNDNTKNQQVNKQASTFKQNSISKTSDKCSHGEYFVGKNMFCKKCGVYFLEVILLVLLKICVLKFGRNIFEIK